MSLLRDRLSLVVLAAYLLAISLPYWLAEAWAPAGTTFLGSLYNSQDTMVYLSAMRAGARGEWLRTLPYTTEPHPPAVYYITYMALGHAAPPNLTTYHAARLGTAVLLGVALYALLGQIARDRLERRIAFILAMLGMGAGFLVSMLGLGHFIRSTDIFLPSATLLGAGMLNAHVPLAAALEFTVLWAYLRARIVPYRRGVLLGGSLTCLALGWTLPYQLAALGGILAMDALLSMWKWKRFWTAETRASFFLLLPGVSAALYYGALQSAMPFWSDLIAQWPQLEKQFAPQDFAAGYGHLWLFALGGVWWLMHQPARAPGERFAILWLLVNAALILAPLSFADRMSLGFGVPLAVLSAVALTRAVPPWLRRQHWGAALAAHYPRFAAHAAWMLLVVVVPSTLLLGAVLALFAAGTGDLPYYLPASDAAALHWLAQHGTPEDVVLAEPAIANVIPALTDARVYAGHTHETYQAERKKEEVRRFFAAEESDNARRAFLREHGITLVYVQPGARGAGMFDGTHANYLVPMTTAGAVTLYRVSGGDAR